MLGRVSIARLASVEIASVLSCLRQSIHADPAVACVTRLKARESCSDLSLLCVTTQSGRV